MSGDLAVRARDVTKLFRLGVLEKSSETMAGALASFFRNPLRNYYKYRSLYRFDEAEEALKRGEFIDSDSLLWALKGVSFDIRVGEVVGIIGTNGAGKSTLLKILSRITGPTSGCVEIRGRVSSLLEVGTGFHPELTGRENVFLNGTILGMTKREVERKFDEIVEFSGVERFLDTPVKRYSSGMKVRLAFAVAAHLEPEILVVDEVLAVGDAAFQRKCLSKMESVGNEGRTVLFVSHQMTAINRLCHRCILLNAGRVMQDGPTHEVVSGYLSAAFGSKPEQVWPDPETAPGDEAVRLLAVRAIGEGGGLANSVDIRRPVRIEIEYEVRQNDLLLLVHFLLTNEEGICIFTGLDQDPQWKGKRRPAGRYRSVCIIPGNFLAEGTMMIMPVIRSLLPDRMHAKAPEAIAFQVSDSLDGDSVRGDYAKEIPGVIRPSLEWHTETLAGA